MKRKFFLSSITIPIVMIALLVSCQPNSTGIPIESSSTPAPTETRQPSKTLVPSATITLPSEPTPTVTPTPTATIPWDDLDTELTPLPEIENTISSENVDEIQQLAVWGMGRPNEISLSANGLILGVGTNAGAYLYDSQNLELLNVLHTQNAVVSIAFSKDNQWVAFGQNNGEIDIYDLAEMTLVARLTSMGIDPEDIQQVTVVFAENGKHLSSILKTDENAHVNAWNTSTWEIDESFSTSIGLASYISSELYMMGTLSEDSLTLQSLSLKTESISFSLPEIAQELFWRYSTSYEGEIAPSSDGEFILFNTGATIVHWQITDDEVTYLLNDYPQKLSDPCYSVPDTCLNQYGGYSWTCNDEPVPPVELIAITPDDIMVLISLNKGGSEFRRTSDGMLYWEIETAYSDITYSPGCEFFFGLMEDGTIEKRTTFDGELMDSLSVHPARLFDMAFSPDGSVLAVGLNDPWIRVYSLSDGKMLGVLTGTARSLSFSPDGSLLAAGLTDGSVRIFQLGEGTYYDLDPGHLSAVTDLVFSSDGKQLITGSDDCTISIWDLAEGKRSGNLSPDEEDPFRITEVEISSGDLLKFVSGNWGSVYQIEDNTYQEISSPFMDEITDLDLSFYDSFLAVSGLSSYLIPNPGIDSAESSLDLDLGQAKTAYAAAFTPDGSLLIQASLQDLTFWSVSDAAFLSSLSFAETAFPNGEPADLEVSPVGNLIALGTRDGLIHIFGIPGTWTE